MTPQTSPIQRKERSEELLKTFQVPVNPNLPLVESEAEARFRHSKEVATRAVVLYELISVAHSGDREDASWWLKEEGLWDQVSPNEKEFLKSDNASKEDMIAVTWRVEALWVLLWAMGKIERLELPKDLCDTEVVQNLMAWTEKQSGADFINRAALRSPAEVLDETDLIYRIHWAVVDARINNEVVPGGFDPGIVYERHYALNWLTCYSDNWDDITTDT